MERPYRTIHKNDTQALAHFLTKNGPALLPMVPRRQENAKNAKSAPEQPCDNVLAGQGSRPFVLCTLGSALRTLNCQLLGTVGLRGSLFYALWARHCQF